MNIAVAQLVTPRCDWDMQNILMRPTGKKIFSKILRKGGRMMRHTWLFIDVKKACDLIRDILRSTRDGS